MAESIGRRHRENLPEDEGDGRAWIELIAGDIRDRLKRCGFRPKHVDDFWAFAQKPEMARLRARTMDRGWTVAVLGPNGTGKTQGVTDYAGHRIARKVWVRKYGQAFRTPRYMTAFDLHSGLRDEDRDRVKALRASCLNADLLVIDELDKVKQDSKFFADELFRIIDARSTGDNDDEVCRDTLLVSNHREDAFCEFVGSSVVDRMANGCVIEMTGGSLR